MADLGETVHAATTHDSSSASGRRRVSFQEQIDIAASSQAVQDNAVHVPAEAGEERLGFGSVRMNSEQLDEWTQSSLSQASVHRCTEAQAAQESEWVDVIQDGRANWSIREAVRLHASRFKDSVCDFNSARALSRAPSLAPLSSALVQLPSAVLVQVAEGALGLGPVVEWVSAWPQFPDRREATVRVAVRKRPLLPFEHDRSEWDCVEADAVRKTILCHDGRLARNGKRLTMVHRRYLLDQVWDESAGNAQVSADSVLPLLRWARRGKSATLLCYGQTGTGKTYTLGGCLELLAEELEKCGEDGEAQLFEVRGQHLYDLLNERAEVHLRADADGLFHLRGAKRESVGVGNGGAAAMQAVLGKALELRASEATERNAASSRSHAILVVWLKGGGMLRFVDLAGSERNYETEKMTGAQHRESADINKSLMALKDCFSAHAALKRGEKARPPYRASRLTQCLRDCFEDSEHRFTLIATISPASSDVIHTVNSLLHASMMAKPLEDARTEVSIDLPLHTGCVATRDVRIAEWNSLEVVEWYTTVERGRFAQLVLPPGIDGSGLLQLSAQGLASMFERDLRNARGQSEGTSWNVTGNEEGQGSGVVLGKALFAAVRREALSATARSKTNGDAAPSASSGLAWLGRGVAGA